MCFASIYFKSIWIVGEAVLRSLSLTLSTWHSFSQLSSVTYVVMEKGIELATKKNKALDAMQVLYWMWKGTSWNEAVKKPTALNEVSQSVKNSTK